MTVRGEKLVNFICFSTSRSGLFTFLRCVILPFLLPCPMCTTFTQEPQQARFIFYVTTRAAPANKNYSMLMSHLPTSSTFMKPDHIVPTTKPCSYSKKSPPKTPYRTKIVDPSHKNCTALLNLIRKRYMHFNDSTISTLLPQTKINSSTPPPPPPQHTCPAAPARPPYFQ